MKLNPQQDEAVQHREGPLLILAGAGSGKTRVITTRILHLINTGISPKAICSVTFTNKSAQEMKERIRHSNGKPIRGLTIGTFHFLGLKIIRENIDLLPITKRFSILGREDQLAIACDIQTELSIDPEEIEEKSIIWNISSIKNKVLTYKDIKNMALQEYGEPWDEICSLYQEKLTNYNSLDFDDLLLMPQELLKKNSKVKAHYRNRWRYLMVDEFQDTNPLQFDFLKHLCPPPYNLCVVGDDDQSIYGWRGADISIILNFKEKFPTAKIIYLNQNYRSTQNILDVANSIIVNNKHRHDKKLWSSNRGQFTPEIHETSDTNDEAEFVLDQINQLVSEKKSKFKDIAILYRTNFQSRPFEELFRLHNIPYHVTGSYQFYDRKEIKDMLSYLRFLANHQDEKSLLRIINSPKRSIGDKTILNIRKAAIEKKVSLWDLINDIENAPLTMSANALSGILQFRDLINKFSQLINRQGQLGHSVEKIISELELQKEFYRSSKDEKIALAKMQNVRELLNSIYQFERDNIANMQSDSGGMLFQYLRYLSLVAHDDNKDEKSLGGKVRLMTLHAAKGLEFESVFLTGLGDGLLPHQKILNESETSEGIDEERRLFYVGITRAKNYLYMSYPACIRNRSEEMAMSASRFLEEIPNDLVERFTANDSSEKSISDALASLKAVGN